jgi:hypothetical protein
MYVLVHTYVRVCTYSTYARTYVEIVRTNTERIIILIYFVRTECERTCVRNMYVRNMYVHDMYVKYVHIVRAERTYIAYVKRVRTHRT